LKHVTMLRFLGKAVLGAVLLRVGFAVVFPESGSSAQAGAILEERKLPMRFGWVSCEPNCRGWISAVGVVTADTPRRFEEFARDRELQGATVVLDSSGGSVNDAIALGRRWRTLGLNTTVGLTIEGPAPGAAAARVAPEAYCESMCVFLLLSGSARYVPEQAKVRVHQIWMGDRADNARVASYSAQDLTIVERDIGRLAKYTFEMGATGDLLALALSVPPWEELYRLSPQELRLTRLITTEALSDLLPRRDAVDLVAGLEAKPHQDRVPHDGPSGDDAAAGAAAPAELLLGTSTKTASAQPGGGMPPGGALATPQPRR
jgi:hypothetical protein